MEERTQLGRGESKGRKVDEDVRRDSGGEKGEDRGRGTGREETREITTICYGGCIFSMNVNSILPNEKQRNTGAVPNGSRMVSFLFPLLFTVCLVMLLVFFFIISVSFTFLSRQQFDSLFWPLTR